MSFQSLSKEKISNTWLKASVLGCLWASSEIVLGSFLHNLRIPFAGNFLTAIGIVLLISVAHIWKEKGLFIRAGIVCALMKTISPSPMIFGPMIAIFAEAFLMEIAVTIFRRNIFSFILAGMLAMSWNLFQFIANYIIIYGYNMVDLYKKLTDFAQNQLKIENSNYWYFILILLSIYMFFGLFCAVIGIYIGRKISRIPKKVHNLTKDQVFEIKRKIVPFNYSGIWLLINILSLVTVFTLMSITQWYYWLFTGIVLFTIWVIRYKNILRPLAKPKFWILFLLITMLSGLLLYNLKNPEGNVFSGILIGLEMNFRAIITISGFAAIGTELRNPSILKLFSGKRLIQLPLAMQTAFDTLPLVIGNLPELKNIFRHPMRIVNDLVSQADFWLNKVELKMNKRDNVIIISGPEKSGKSSYLEKLVLNLKNRGIKTGGFICPSVFENDIKIGHDLLDINSDKRLLLSRNTGTEDMPKVGNYFFNNDALRYGIESIELINLYNTEIVVIDEVGPWELSGQGWAENLNQLVKLYKKPMIWVVRESIVEKVIENWSLEGSKIVDINLSNVNLVFENILSHIQNPV
ncbi:MAG: nucleoside-triphosphatase [Bacteroidota bacterium]